MGVAGLRGAQGGCRRGFGDWPGGRNGLQGHRGLGRLGFGPMGAAAYQGGGSKGHHHDASATKAKLTLAGQLDCRQGWPVPLGQPTLQPGFLGAAEIVVVQLVF